MEPKNRRGLFWRIGVGGILLLLGLRGLDQRDIPPSLIPSNSGQWVGFYFASFLIIGAALVLIFFGVQRVLRRPPES